MSESTSVRSVPRTFLPSNDDDDETSKRISRAIITLASEFDANGKKDEVLGDLKERLTGDKALTKCDELSENAFFLSDFEERL